MKTKYFVPQYKSESRYELGEMKGHEGYFEFFSRMGYRRDVLNFGSYGYGYAIESYKNDDEEIRVMQLWIDHILIAQFKVNTEEHKLELLKDFMSLIKDYTTIEVNIGAMDEQ